MNTQEPREDDAYPERQMPDNACLLLYRITGDEALLEQAGDMREQALALEPGDPLLLGNSAELCLALGLRQLAGDLLKTNELRVLMEPSFLPLLYKDQEGRQKYREMMASNKSIQNAIEYFRRVRILAPERIGAYKTLARIYEFLDDVDSLRTLNTQLEEAELHLTEHIKASVEYYRGQDDPAGIAETRRLSGIWRNVLPAPSASGDATSAAAGIFLAGMARANRVEESPDRIVELTEQAHDAYPSAGALTSLEYALYFRACSRLAGTDPEFKAVLRKVRRSLSPATLVAATLLRGGALADHLRDDADFRRGLKLRLEYCSRFPSVGPLTYVLLHAGSEETAERAKEARQQALADDSGRLYRSIVLRLEPTDADNVYATAWMLQLEGKEDAARKLLHDCADLGVPLPFDP